MNATLFLFEAVVLAIILDTQMRHAAGRPLAESRRDGTLELLLTTPLTIPKLVGGLQSAIRSQFAPVIKIFGGVFAALMLAGFATRAWSIGALVDYVILWGWMFFWLHRIGRANCTRTLWLAMNTGRSGLSAWWTNSRNRFGLIYVMFLFYQVTTGWSSTGKVRLAFPTGETAELVLVIFSSVVILIFVAAVEEHLPGAELQTSLIFHFREIAMEPVPEANDPRLKNWDQSSRLPSAWRGSHLVERNLKRKLLEPAEPG